MDKSRQVKSARIWMKRIFITAQVKKKMTSENYKTVKAPQ